MSTKIRLLWAAALLSLGAIGSAALPDQVAGQPVQSLAPLVKKVSPAVVNIRVSQTIATRSPFADDTFRRFFGIPTNARLPVLAPASSLMPRMATYSRITTSSKTPTEFWFP